MNAFAILVLLALPMSAPRQNVPAASLPELTKLAQAGDAKAQFELGQMYEDGRGVTQDDELAATWFRKAADQGNAGAQNSLGIMYSQGRGVARDREEAVRWYKKAAKQGLSESEYNVAIAYFNGEGVTGNLDFAYAWMLAADRKANSQAHEAVPRIAGELHGRLENGKLRLAEMYERGDELPKDASAAADLFLEIAKGDYRTSKYVTGAQYKLCELYAAGDGASQDYGEAKSWCKKSVSTPKGSLSLPVDAAYIALGRMAARGLGQPVDLKEAEAWFKKATGAFSSTSFMELGKVKLMQGRKEQSEAYYWFYLAKQFDVASADEQLRKAADGLSEHEMSKQKKKAYEFLKTSFPDKAKAIKAESHS
jgi:TPR repeat protein